MNKESDQGHVYHGSNFPEYEDLLVGNKRGLERLRLAIDEALEHGESEIDSGEFFGVKRLDTSYFEDEQDETSWFFTIMGWLIRIGGLFIFGVGLATVYSWFGEKC
ncbi:MAG: hypothetical protein K6L76_02475 [Agarilytica sp.]